jgi:hypothetical protein
LHSPSKEFSFVKQTGVADNWIEAKLSPFLTGWFYRG